MHQRTLSALAPPLADGYEVLPFARHEGRLDAGLLRCPVSQVAVPVIGGFALFPEATPYSPRMDRSWLDALGQRCFGLPGSYDRFLDDKRRRPVHDAYAAFQPFSEAGRAIVPLVSLLRERLQPGDLIVDLHCRTGWSGEFLASLFPEQHVVALWAGNNDVLGYRGFHHWLGACERAPNLDILFHPADGPLPFRDGAAALVHGFDYLHHHPPTSLLVEASRVAGVDGMMVFPHVHLNNGEPDPWFERDGDVAGHLHGTAYRDAFDALGDRQRRLFVLSERALFEGTCERLVDDSATEHYNGLVIIADRQLEGRPLDHATVATEPDACRLLLNPLCHIDLERRSVQPDSTLLGGRAAALLGRHPIYGRRLDRVASGPLSQLETRVLYWAERHLTVGAIAATIGCPDDDVRAATTALVRREVVAAWPVSEGMARLQHYYRTQQSRPSRRGQTLSQLWIEATSVYADRPYLLVEDEPSFTYADAATVVTGIRERLRTAGIGPGDRICVYSGPHPEAVLVFWAAVTSGAVFVPIDRAWPMKRAAAAISSLGPRIVFTDSAEPELATTVPQIRFDSLSRDDDDRSDGLFSFWLDDADPAIADDDATPDPSDVAVVLFTSGTTLPSAAVELSHGAMWNTSRLLAETYDLSSDDVLLAPGGLHAVSGLRNPVICTAQVGAACVVPAPSDEARAAIAAVGLIERYGVSVLTANPAFLRRLCDRRSKVEAVALASLRVILSTAANLSAAARTELCARLGAPVYDYYGLTETCGVCILVAPGDDVDAGIGRSAGAIAEVVNDGLPVAIGEVGELRIYSANVMRRRIGRPVPESPDAEPWCHETGDLAWAARSGHIHLVGRKGGFMKHRSGDLISLATVERALVSHPGVAAAAVGSFIDELEDERISAVVVPNAGARLERADLLRFLDAELGAAYVPDRLVIGAGPALPEEEHI